MLVVERDLSSSRFGRPLDHPLHPVLAKPTNKGKLDQGDVGHPMTAR